MIVRAHFPFYPPQDWIVHDRKPQLQIMVSNIWRSAWLLLEVRCIWLREYNSMSELFWSRHQMRCEHGCAPIDIQRWMRDEQTAPFSSSYTSYSSISGEKDQFTSPLRETKMFIKNPLFSTQALIEICTYVHTHIPSTHPWACHTWVHYNSKRKKAFALPGCYVLQAPSSLPELSSSIVLVKHGAQTVSSIIFIRIPIYTTNISFEWHNGMVLFENRISP